MKEYKHEMNFIGAFADSIRDDVRGCEWEDVKNIKTIIIGFILQDGMHMHKAINVKNVFDRIEYRTL